MMRAPGRPGMLCLKSSTRVVYLWGALILVAALWGVKVSALNAEKVVTQYPRRTWQIEDGLPQNSVFSVIQSSDGYIWFGTQEGLVRFDGVKFTVFDKKHYPSMNHNYVMAICEDEVGSLWLGTIAGLARFQAGKFTNYTA